MRGTPWKTAFLAAPALLLLACRSQGADRVVTLSWTANREVGVNTPGGGYRISISGRSPVDVPYASGPLAPTTKDVTLRSGSYTVTITAYAALDAQGGTSGSQSAPSQAITVHVP